MLAPLQIKSILARADAQTDVRAFVEWTTVSRGGLRSSLGTVAMPRRAMVKDSNCEIDRLCYAIDVGRRLESLPADRQRLVCLLAMGHSQQCAAQELGISLRSATRFAAKAWDDLETVQSGSRQLRSKQPRIELMAPPAVCRCKQTGRPPKSKMQAVSG